MNRNHQMTGQVRSFAAGGQAQDLRQCGQNAAGAIGAMKRLMDERLSLMTEVARQKWNTKGAIEDLQREKEIVAGLKVEAAELGLPELWAERFFRAQIEAGKVIQRECFVNWGQAGVGQFGNALDLARVIRPRLARSTPNSCVSWCLAGPFWQIRRSATALPPQPDPSLPSTANWPLRSP